MLDEVEDYVNGKPIKQYRVLVKSPVYGWRKSLSHTLLMFLRDGGTDG
jgi:hypothetical protein